MAAKTNQELHFRVWRGRTAVSACRKSTQATTTPTPGRVTCTQCVSQMIEA